MPMGGGSGQNTDDQALYLFWGIFGAIVAALLLWYVEKDIIVRAFFAVRSVEIDIILPVVKFIYYMTGLLHLPQPDISHLYKAKLFINTFQLSQVSWGNIEELNTLVGDYFRWATILIAMGAGLYLFRFHRLARYVQIYSMKSLRKLEVDNWPQITPVLNTDLIKTPLNEGPWASARTPFDFCKDHNLLLKPSDPDDVAWHVNKQQSMRYFTIQMGALMPKDIANLPIHLQALLVIFVLRANGKDKLSLDLIYQISKSATGGKLDFSGISEHLESIRGCSLLQWLYKRHSFVTTFMARALDASRSAGVLSTSDFLWLKPLDRRAWYMLNSVGRQTCVVETSGPFAHFLAEKRFNRAIKSPMIKQAGEALERAIREIKYTEAGDSWQSKEA